MDIRDLTPARWDDFASLCRRMGGNKGCWCMWWREERGAERTRPRRTSARELVDDGPPPGVLAYVDGEPVGWAAVAPREAYPRLNTARDTPPPEGTDMAATWLVSCFFVLESHRGTGVSRALLDGAVDLARRHGARAVEGVPIDREVVTRTPGGSFTGSLPMFTAAGFAEVARPKPKGRVTVRRTLQRPRQSPRPNPAGGFR
ncbi:GNAT family N-acetyltransferase [Phytomonospora sp. NPDC050363]|uniref:GNAT family N-acetyltransferase n=1 Tax=Phytomonospora sp. NPDC050363 TaxID=3155642 RepID=UPI0033D166C1